MDSNKYLLTLCLKGFQKRSPSFVTSKHIYKERLLMEYRMIAGLGYSDYFLIIQDIVVWAREQGIEVGPARGSVAGSLLAYCVEITSVDPIKFDLMFERFLNPVRAKFDPPDCDLDFQASRRDEVKQYIADKYGEDKVCGIGSHSRAYSSGTIKDVAKVLGLDFQELNQAVAGKLFDRTLEEAYDSKTGVASFRQWVDTSAQHLKAYEIACQLQGLVRHRSVHPSGIVIAPGAIEEYVPVIIVKGQKVTQWKDSYVGHRGILKVDILGLNTLDILAMARNLIGDTSDLLDIPLDDPDVLALFSHGDTLGVFQFDAPHQSRIMARLGADSFDDIVLASAISRPGSSRVTEEGVPTISDSVIERKHGREEVEYPHEIVREVLQETYGYPVYQELVMKMAHVAGGIPLVDTEIMRDAIKHFRNEVMAQYEQQFMEGAAERGVGVDQANTMWEWIQAASDYGFNKSHATAYSLISYYCAHYKHYYPLEFMTACLAREGNADKVVQLMSEARRLGITVKRAHVNESRVAFSTDGECIIAGLNSIKYVGDKAAEAVVASAPYSSTRDLTERVSKRSCTSRVQEALRKAGALGGKPKPTDIVESYGGWVGKLPKLHLDEISECEMCDLRDGCRGVVSGHGWEQASIMFIGEAPGSLEDLQGKPFVGRSGGLLVNDWFRQLKLVRGRVWITNTVKCMPTSETGQMTKPTEAQSTVCSLWLNRELDVIQPKLVVTLGGVALKAVSHERSIMAARGKTFDVISHVGGRKKAVGFPLYHPAFILRNMKEGDDYQAKVMESIRSDLKVLRLLIKELDL